MLKNKASREDKQDMMDNPNTGVVSLVDNSLLVTLETQRVFELLLLLLVLVELSLRYFLAQGCCADKDTKPW